MDKTWNTTYAPLSEKLILWIKSKIEDTKKGTILIEVKDSKVISIHLYTSENVYDVDKLEN